MPDTGAPWNIPYVTSTDLVSDWPADSLALANAIDAGLDAAGGLVAVKSALFTGTQTNSTAAGADFAVTNLSITHTMASASNKIIFHAFLGAAGNSFGRGEVGISVFDGATAVAVGGSPSNRVAISAGGPNTQIGSFGTEMVSMPSMHVVYEPNDTSSHTYTVRASNISTSTRTIYINRLESDTDDASRVRTVSALLLLEVSV